MGLGMRGVREVRTWDLWTRGCGTRGSGDVGLGDARMWDAGTWDSGVWGRRNSGTSGRKDVINKQHLNFALNLQFTIFGD